MLCDHDVYESVLLTCPHDAVSRCTHECVLQNHLGVPGSRQCEFLTFGFLDPRCLERRQSSSDSCMYVDLDSLASEFGFRGRTSAHQSSEHCGSSSCWYTRRSSKNCRQLLQFRKHAQSYNTFVAHHSPLSTSLSPRRCPSWQFRGI